MKINIITTILTLFFLTSITLASNQLTNKIKTKINYLTTPDGEDACFQSPAFDDDDFFKSKLADLEYLIIFLSRGHNIGPMETNIQSINNLLERSIADDAYGIDILVCNKIISTVKKELIALRVFVDKNLSIEYDPLNNTARNISWQSAGFRHVLHLQDVHLHRGKYLIWNAGDISILPIHFKKHILNDRKFHLLGKIDKAIKKGKLILTEQQQNIVNIANH